MAVVVRRCEPSDAQAVAKLYSNTNAYTHTLQLPLPSSSQWEQRFKNIPDNVYAYVATIDKKVVGNIGFEVCTSPRRKHVASFGMGVADDCQGKGIGSALMETVIDLADNWLNLQRIEITVYTDNQAAIALYKKFGFVVEGEANKFAFRNGEYVSVYHMARIK